MEVTVSQSGIVTYKQNIQTTLKKIWPKFNVTRTKGIWFMVLCEYQL